MENPTITFEAHAQNWSDYIDQDGTGENYDPVVEVILEFASELGGLTLLDAGCGEGCVSRKLSQRGAQVTAVDVSPSLVKIASGKPFAEKIDYQSQDLSKPLPEKYDSFFDLVVSNLVLMDVSDYAGFIQTIAKSLKTGGRAIVSLKSPYESAVVGRVKDYFDSGKGEFYQGLYESTGIRVPYYHRTLEEYVTAFRDSDLLLRSLSDVGPTDGMAKAFRERVTHFPAFFVLEFIKT